MIHKDVEIKTVALKNGFNDNATFTRVFKKYYGISPTTFRKQNPHRFSKIRQYKGKNGQVYPDYKNTFVSLMILKTGSK